MISHGYMRSHFWKSTKKTFILLILILCIVSKADLQRGSQDLTNNNSASSVESKHIPDDAILPELSGLNQFETQQHILPDSDLIDNSALLQSLNSHLADFSLEGSRSNSIMAAYYFILSVKVLDPTYLMNIEQDITNYVLSKYNTTSNHFEETINYSRFSSNSIDYLIQPYSSHLVHQMAIIILSEFNALNVYFNVSQLHLWEQEIWNLSNPDGGFGMHYSPRSSLLETFFAIQALWSLADYQPEYFSQEEIVSISEYIYSCQDLGENFPFLKGVFKETNSDPNLGWENFYASWLAIKILDLIGGNKEPIVENFRYFIASNDLYQEDTHSLYDQWNQKFHSDFTSFLGTAMLGYCIDELNLSEDFPEFALTQETLLNAISDSVDLDNTKGTYFLMNTVSKSDDLFTQYQILNFLAYSNRIQDFKSSSEIYSKYFTHLTSRINYEGQISYISPVYQSTQKLYNQFHYGAETLSLNNSELFKNIMSYYDGLNAYFHDFQIQDVQYSPKNLYMQLWNEIDYHPLRSTYFCFQLLQDFQLLDSFYYRVGLKYLEFEDWLVEQYHSSNWGIGDNYIAFIDNFENLYYFVASLNILITYNTGQSFDDYLTLPEQTNICNYYRSFVVQNETVAFFRDSAGMDYNEFQATYYGFSVLNILNGFSPDFTAINLSNDVINYMTITSQDYLDKSNKWQAEFTNLWTFFDISMISDLIFTNHEFVREIGNEMMSTNVLIPNLVKIYHSLKQINQLFGYISCLELQEIQTSQSYTIQFWSLLTIEIVSSMYMYGIHNVYPTWTNIDNMWIGEVIVEMNHTNPYTWFPTISAMWNSKEFRSKVLINTTFAYSFNASSNQIEDEWLLSFQIFSDIEVLETLIPIIHIYQPNGIEIQNYTLPQINQTLNEDWIIYEVNLNGICQPNISFNALCSFQQSWIEEIHYEGIFIGSNSSLNEETPPDDADDDKSNSTNPGTSGNDTVDDPSSESPGDENNSTFIGELPDSIHEDPRLNISDFGGISGNAAFFYPIEKKSDYTNTSKSSDTPNTNISDNLSTNLFTKYGFYSISCIGVGVTGFFGIKIRKQSKFLRSPIKL